MRHYFNIERTVDWAIRLFNKRDRLIALDKRQTDEIAWLEARLKKVKKHNDHVRWILREAQAISYIQDGMPIMDSCNSHRGYVTAMPNIAGVRFASFWSNAHTKGKTWVLSFGHAARDNQSSLDSGSIYSFNMASAEECHKWAIHFVLTGEKPDHWEKKLLAATSRVTEEI